MSKNLFLEIKDRSGPPRILVTVHIIQRGILPVVLAICPAYLQISSSGHFLCTNNVADHEALLIKLELATAMGIRSIHVNVNKGDSQLVVRQVIAEYQAIEAKQ